MCDECKITAPYEMDGNFDIDNHNRGKAKILPGWVRVNEKDFCGKCQDENHLLQEYAAMFGLSIRRA